MLQHLSIKNYALIQELSIDFSGGLTIITGETGAGKSILLGALGLVLGNRADSSTLLQKDEKCIVEAELSLSNYNLESFFEEVDLDYDKITILRREILPSGKSRAFVNDTPVTLGVLGELKSKLIDIHSQHQTLRISDSKFQFDLIDAIGNNKVLLDNYQKELTRWKSLNLELQQLIEKQREAHQQFDYNQHLYKELEEANLQKEEQEDLEEKLDKLNHIEEIKLNLSESLQLATDENLGLQNLLNSLLGKLRNISSFAKKYEELYNRVDSVTIEFDDLIAELENENENIEFNPNEAELLNDRLQLIYSLQKKHYVNSIEELLVIQEQLSEKVNQVESAEDLIASKRNAIAQLEESLKSIANEIRNSRTQIIPDLSSQLEKIVADLGMPQGRFDIQLKSTDDFLYNGMDELIFSFSANKGVNFGDLKKVASGGELSRIMLAIKKIKSENSKLPTIIFDEIDTGVSGEISNKMAAIMKEMSKQMQVITITHLPQIAAKGDEHFKVYKSESETNTFTNLKLLSNDERIVEIAEMLSGKNISDSAITHAKELLN